MRNQQNYNYIVDLDERGDFSAHVETAKGKIIFEMSTDQDGFLDLVEDGYIKHARDMQGLKSYLVDSGMIPEESQLKYIG
jgi:hypothetical protein